MQKTTSSGVSRGGGDDAVGLRAQLPVRARHALRPAGRAGRVLDRRRRRRSARRRPAARARDCRSISASTSDDCTPSDRPRPPQAAAPAASVITARTPAVAEVEVELGLLELRVQRHDDAAELRDREEADREAGTLGSRARRGRPARARARPAPRPAGRRARTARRSRSARRRGRARGRSAAASSIEVTGASATARLLASSSAAAAVERRRGVPRAPCGSARGRSPGSAPRALSSISSYSSSGSDCMTIAPPAPIVVDSPSITIVRITMLRSEPPLSPR